MKRAMEENTYPVKLVRDVAKHHRSTNVAAIENALTADTVVLIVWVAVVASTAVGVLIRHLMGRG